MSLVSANVYIYKANVYIYKAERTLLYAKKDINVSCFRLLDIKWRQKRAESRYVVLPSPITQEQTISNGMPPNQKVNKVE